MNKTEAQAILAFQTAINLACTRLEKKLTEPSLKRYAEAYYLTHIRQSANGQTWGGAPIEEAEKVLGMHWVRE